MRSIYSKAELRKSILERRKNMSQEEVAEKSRNIVKQILALDEYKEADCIYAYISTRNEVDLTELIETAGVSGKRIAVPRVSGYYMDFYYISSFSDLVKGNFGIFEPADYTVKANERDAFVLIPGVVYDKSGNRIGYGGGYYDKYFAEGHSHYIVAPAYEFQVVGSINASFMIPEFIR